MKKQEFVDLALMVIGGGIFAGAMIDVYIDIWDILTTFGPIGFCVVFLGKFLLRGIGLLGIGLIYLGIFSLREGYDGG